MTFGIRIDVYHHLIPGVTIQQVEEKIMAAKDEINQTIADEKAQVQAGIDALNTKISLLEGQVLSAADVQEIKDGIAGIFTPPEPTE